MPQEITIYTLLVATLAAAVKAGTPILYAALGEVMTERAGVLNLGVEGMMLVGAVSGFTVAMRTENLLLGVAAAMAAGALLATIHGLITVTLRANQVVSGLALTIFGTGLSSFLGKPMIGQPLPVKFEVGSLPVLGNIPFIGPILFSHDTLVYATYVLVPVLWWYMFRTRPGLHMRAVGENPAAADAMGINVYLTRYAYVAAGGALSGLGGAYLSLAYAPSWVEYMTAGRGWVAVALVIFAMWNPARALLGAYLFGGVEALTFRVQAVGTNWSPFILHMLPYLFTIVVLMLASSQNMRKRLGAPAALGLAYDREGK